MRKKIFDLIIFIILLAFCISSSNAIFQKQIIVTSQGIISYNSPSPTPTSTLISTGENLADIPEDIHSQNFDDDTNSFNYDYLNLDYDVVRTPGQPSIRIDKLNTDRNSRECFFSFRSVRPGDRVVYRAWVKTENHDNTYRGGVKILIDLTTRVDGTMKTVDSVPRCFTWIDGVVVSGYDQGGYYDMEPEDGVYPMEGIGHPSFTKFGAHWGTSEWTLIEWDFIIPSTWYVSKTTGSRAQISYIAPNMDVREWQDDASAWVADTELYINP